VTGISEPQLAAVARRKKRRLFRGFRQTGGWGGLHTRTHKNLAPTRSRAHSHARTPHATPPHHAATTTTASPPRQPQQHHLLSLTLARRATPRTSPACWRACVLACCVRACVPACLRAACCVLACCVLALLGCYASLPLLPPRPPLPRPPHCHDHHCHDHYHDHHACLLPACVPACWACLPACFVLACWRAGLLACWRAGLLACWRAGLLLRSLLRSRVDVLACWPAGVRSGHRHKEPATSFSLLRRRSRCGSRDRARSIVIRTPASSAFTVVHATSFTRRRHKEPASAFTGPRSATS
jgi:hypothetical protein